MTPSANGPSASPIVHVEFDALVASFLERSRMPGVSAGVVDEGGLAWSLGMGFAELDSYRGSDATTLYEIASLTKPFTATAIMQLRDEGRLALDDPLVRQLPEFAAARNPFGPVEMVTLRHVLQHTSGLQSEAPNHDPRALTVLPTCDVIAKLGAVSVAIPPGTAVKYSNLGYQLLGEVVSRISGRPYWEYVTSEILRPLGMKSTTHWPTGPLAERCAVGHRARRFDEGASAEPTIDPQLKGAAGGLWSSVEDLARWVAQQFRTAEGLDRGDGQVLSGPSLAELQRPVFVGDQRLTHARGLGWFVERHGDSLVVGHTGFNGGFTSQIAFCPVDRLGAIVLTNGTSADPGPLDCAQRLIEVARPSVRSARARREPHPPSRTPPEWRELLGCYWSDAEGISLRIQARRGRLVGVWDDLDGPMRLDATDDPLCWTVRDGRPAGESARFFRRDDGAIEGVNVAGFPMIRLDPANYVAPQ